MPRAEPFDANWQRYEAWLQRHEAAYLSEWPLRLRRGLGTQGPVKRMLTPPVAKAATGAAK